MITLNLTAKGTEQELIKKYLEENASETLAEKINNGVRIEKDGKTLINKKSLDGFMKYATDEAKKLAEKGASAACVRSDVVFGWAIHYFEKESIVGKLYNEDGSEYKAPKPVVKKTTTAPASTYTPPVAKKPEWVIIPIKKSEVRDGIWHEVPFWKQKGAFLLYTKTIKRRTYK